MSHRNLVILTKIILIYSIFYVVMKLVVLFQGAWLIPNLILMVPFLALTLVSGLQVKSEKYSWAFVGLGAALIIVIRIFETQLSVWIQQMLA